MSRGRTKPTMARDSVRTPMINKKKHGTHPCPPRVLGIPIHQVYYVIGDSGRCIPCRKQPICNISCLFKENVVIREIIRAKKSAYNSIINKSSYNKSQSLEMTRRNGREIFGNL